LSARNPHLLSISLPKNTRTHAREQPPTATGNAEKRSPCQFLLDLQFSKDQCGGGGIKRSKKGMKIGSRSETLVELASGLCHGSLLISLPGSLFLGSLTFNPAS
jgi:hypothetical protein